MNKAVKKMLPALWILGITLVVAITGVGAEEKEKLKQHDFTWAVSADTVSDQLLQKVKPVLIDVRSADQFDRAKIKDSVNMPLYTVKTKTYLKNRHVILIDEGYNYGRLATECKTLNEMGFNASILFGGLNAWGSNDGTIEGDQFVLGEIKKISPRAFHLEKEFGHHWVIDISEEDQTANPIYKPNRIHLKEVDEAALRSAFSDGPLGTKGQNGYLTVVVASESGLEYEKVEKILQKINAAGTFYLEGGFDAYLKHFEGLLASRKPRKNRVRQQNCVGCGKRNSPVQ